MLGLIVVNVASQHASTFMKRKRHVHNLSTIEGNILISVTMTLLPTQRIPAETKTNAFPLQRFPFTDRLVHLRTSVIGFHKSAASQQFFSVTCVY